MSNKGSDEEQVSSDENEKDVTMSESDDESKDKKIGGKKYGKSIVILKF